MVKYWPLDGSGDAAGKVNKSFGEKKKTAGCGDKTFARRSLQFLVESVFK